MSDFVQALEDRWFFSVSAAVGAVNVRPTIGAVIAAPNPVVKGAAVTLVASGASDSDGTIARVEFYRDVDGDGLFNRTIDTFVGADSSARHGYRVPVDSGTLNAGRTRFFARSRDDQGSGSKFVGTVLTVNNVLKLVGDYEGTIAFDDGTNDLLEGRVTSQTGQSFFHGTLHQVGAGANLSFDANVGSNNTVTIAYAGDASGTGTGRINARGTELKGTFKTKAANGQTFAGTFAIHRA